jgi:hypothetical protein
MKKIYIRILIAAVALIGILSPFAVWIATCALSDTRDTRPEDQPTPLETFVSPDKRFKLEVYSKPSSFFELIMKFVVPSIRASSSDDPVIVILKDSNGAIINSCDVPMMMLVDKVIWEDNSVRVPAVLDWDLPQETSTVASPKSSDGKPAKH